nr:Stk1 family PASTA domain-containing Ser/Thr kinase [Ectobacillus ponti]
MIGRRLNDRYKLMQMIGGGGMANVYLAHDGILDRDVAVKILRLDYANNEEFIKRFHREAQSVTTLSHPNIVNIYDVGEEDGIYYLVMEYVPGQTLKQYIQQAGMLPVEKALDIMEQLTSAMAHAHHFAIVHRDIKPQNILIRDDGVVKVTDFGIATATSATTITHTNSVLGSVHYLSPEQARGGVANKKSDIYSLGIVMFELLTGRPPFSGESAVSIALKHLQHETPSPKRWNPAIPQSVENIVLKATAKDPFHRYDSVDEMREAVVTALYPERANEQRFHIPEDEDATKAIPIIRHDTIVPSDSEETIVSTGKPEEVKKSKPAKSKKKRLVLLLTAIFLLLGVSGVLALTVVPGFFIPKDVTVPDVSGMSYEKALTVITSKGLKVASSSPQIVYTEDVEEGKVIGTKPDAGRQVKENSEVAIIQSGGKQKKKMRNLVGQQYSEVKDELKAQYKEVLTYYTNNDRPKGEILEQVPAADQEVIEKEQEVRLWISDGPKRTALSDFSGWTENSVRSYAADKKLKVEVSQEYSETLEKGLVLSQSPKAGAQLKEGDSFTIVISAGPKEKPPKTVTVTVQVPYEPVKPEDAGKPQKIEVYKEDMEHTMSEAVETRPISATTSLSIDLIIPYGKKARYKIVRDGVTILEKEVPYPAD